jgi:hypothetical protein
MNNFTNQRLETLYLEAQRYAQLEDSRQQDRAALGQALCAMFEIVKHWTIGIPTDNRRAQRKTT